MRIIKSQSGNIFAMLFAAVGMTGVLGVVGMQTVSGPITTITKVTQKNMIDTDLMTNARIVILDAGTQPAGGDGDADNYVEPAPFETVCSKKPAGGGCLPTDIGAVQTDPFGTPYGYCVWDHGSVDTSTNRLQGKDDTSEAVIAVISAGADKTFQTSCEPFDGSAPEGLQQVTTSDDSVRIYTYDAAVAGANGLWQVKDGDPTVAQIAKNLEVGDVSGGTGFSFDTSTGEGDFPRIKTDIVQAKTGQNVDVLGGLRLDDQVSVTSCAAGDAGAMRYNTTDGSMEICDGADWNSTGEGWRIVDGDFGGNTYVSVAGADNSANTDEINFTVNGTSRLTIRNSGEFFFDNGSSRFRSNSSFNFLTEGGQSQSIKTGGILLGNTYGPVTPDDGQILTSNNIPMDFRPNDVSRMVLEADGDVAIDTNTLFVDATNNRVGIGTASPDVELEVIDGTISVVNSTAKEALRTLTALDRVAKFESSDASASIILQDSNSTNNANRIRVLGDSMGFITADTEAVRITSAGNVGIGTSSPVDNLHIHDSGTDSRLYITNSNTGQSASDGLLLESDSAGDAYLWNYENRRVLIGTNNTARIYVQATGDVGIGEGSPTSKLHVDGAIQMSSGICGGAQEGAIQYTSANNIQYCNGASWQTITGAVSELRDVGNVDISSDPVDGAVLVWSNVDKDWNALSTGDLDVDTANAAKKIIDADGDTQVQVEEGTDDDTIRFDTAGVEVGVMNSSGLTVQGNLYLDYSATSQYTGINIGPEGNDRIFSDGNGAYGGGLVFRVHDDAASFDYRDVMILSESGNVGIGGTTPTSALEVSSLNSSTALGVNNAFVKIKNTSSTPSALSGIGFVVNNSTAAGARILAQNLSSNGGANLIFSTRDNLGVETEKLSIISATGNIGIGTSTPAAKLEVSGTDSILFPRGTTAQQPSSPVNGMMRYNSDNDKYEAYQGGSWQDIITSGAGGVSALSDADGDTMIQVEEGADDDTIRFDTAGVQRMAIDENGNIGIGGAPDPLVKIKSMEILTDQSAYNAQKVTTMNTVEDGAYYMIADGNRITASVAATKTNTGYYMGKDISLLRRYASDEGGLTSLIGQRVQMGHFTGLGATAATTNAIGLYVNPYAQAGTITNMYGLYITATGGGGTVTNDYGIYQAGTTSKNYFGGNVGIGTTSPTRSLEVFDSTQDEVIRAVSGDATAIISIHDDTGYINLESTAGEFRIDTDSGSTGNAFVVDTGGNVGIGTTSPAAKLEVAGTDSILFPRGTTAQQPSAPVNGMMRYNSDNDKYEAYQGGSWQDIITSGAGGVSALSDADNDTMIQVEEGTDDDTIRFDTAGTERMVILPSGHVGIGAESPAEILHLASSVGDTKLIIEADTDNNEEDDNAFIVFRGDGGSEQSAIWSGNIDGSNDNALVLANATDVGGGIRFATSSASGYTNAVTRMIVDVDGNVGIGTITPSATLNVQSGADVNTPIAAANLIVAESSANNGISILSGDSNTGSLVFGDASDSFVGGLRYDHTANQLDMYSNNAIALSINSSGNVGIGTTSPAQQALSLFGGNADRVVHLSTDTPGDKLSYRLSNPGGGRNSRAEFFMTDGATEAERIWGLAQTYSTGGDADFVIANPAEMMRIKASGDVGIGTDSPSNGLHVANSQSGSSNEGITIENTANGWGGSLTFKVNAGSSYDAGQIVSQNHGTGGRLVLRTSNTSAVLQNRMTITNNGDVGIGTGAPEASLDVAGTDAILFPRGIVGNRPSTPVNGMMRYNTASGKFEAYQSGAWADIITSGAGGVTALSDADGDTQIQVEEGADDDTIRFDTAGTERLVILPNGNVGIGTASPGATLELQTSAANQVNMATAPSGSLQFGSASGNPLPAIGGRVGTDQIGLYLVAATNDTNPNPDMVIDVRENDNSAFATTTSGGIQFSSFNNSLMRILRSGNVGIGTSAPSANLEIEDDVEVKLVLNETGGNELQIYQQNVSSYLIADDNWRFYTNSGERMIINAAGNVGIGTSTPQSDLSILRSVAGTTPMASFYDASASNLRSDISVSAYRAGIIIDDISTNADDFRVGVESNKLMFSSDIDDDGDKDALSNFDDINIMTLQSNGNVGIGTNSPIAKLSIADDVKFLQFEESDGTVNKRRYDVVAVNDKLAIRAINDSNSYVRDLITMAHDGNIGLGTSAPTDMLHISKGDNPSMLITRAGGDNIARLGDLGSGDSGYLQLFSSTGSETIRLSSSTTGGGVNSWIAAGGNLGIGTTIPAAKLDVAGTDAILFPRGIVGNRPSTPVNGMMRYNTATDMFEAYQGGAWEDILTGAIPSGTIAINDLTDGISDGSSLFLGADAGINDDGTTNGNTSLGIGTLKVNTTGANNTAVGLNALAANATTNYNTAMGVNALSVNTGSNNTAMGVNALHLNSSGNNNVGMGLNAGIYSGATGTTANATGSQSVFIGNNTRANGSGEINQIVIGDNAVGNGSNSVTLGNDTVTNTFLKGNVGVGTTSTVNQVDIRKSGQSDLSLWNTANSVRGLLVAGTSNFSIQKSGGGVMDFLSTGNINFSSGNVGIGTASPAAKLDITTTGTQPGLRLKNDSLGADKRAVMFYSSNSQDYEVGLNPGGGGANNWGIRDLTAAGSPIRFALAPSGNVGIGTDSPTASLTIAKEHSGKTGIRFENATGGLTNSEIYVDNAGINFKNYNGSRDFVFTTGDLRMANGVGAYGAGRIRTSSTGDVVGFTMDSTTRGWDLISIVSTATDYFAIRDYTAGVDRFSIDENGKIGIGTNVPAAKLDVTGTDAILFPRGIVGNRPSTPVNGMMRYNTATDMFEAYQGGAWEDILTGAIPSGTIAINDLTDAERDSTNNNLFIGETYGSALANNDYNTSIGINALQSLSNTATVNHGDWNTAVGFSSLRDNTEGYNNTAVGYTALYFNTTGASNTATGVNALRTNTTGSSNTATGIQALYTNATGSNNTANGRSALFSNTTGNFNTGFGINALYGNTTGSDNTALGYRAGRYIADGSTANATSGTSMFLGASTKASADGVANEIVIGYDAIGNGSNSVTLGNDNVTKTVLRGNVGIGTNAPNARLQIDDLTGNSGDNLIVLNENRAGYTGGAVQRGLGFSFNDDLLALMGLYTSATSGSYVDGTEYFYINTTNLNTPSAANFVIRDNGNVGINTLTPNAALDVNGRLRVSEISPALIIKDSDSTGDTHAGWVSLQDSSGIERGWMGFGSSSNDDISIQNNYLGGHIILTANGGNVGIGTTSPKTTLDVAGTDSILFPRGTTAQQPSSPVNGMMRYNSDNDKFEAYQGGSWADIITTGAGTIAINDLSDGASDATSVFLGLDSGINDDGTANNNVAVGIEALKANTSGANNTAVGRGALIANTTGGGNTAFGFQALFDNIGADGNTAIGVRSMYNNTIGAYNVATGTQSLYTNTEGDYNTVTGYQSMYNNTTGDNNIATGYRSLFSNTTGVNNVATGLSALYTNTTGYNNVVNGNSAMYSNTTGINNVATGHNALYSNTTGYYNTVNGFQVLYDNTTGINNTAFGYNTGRGITTGSNNTIIGANVTGLSATLANNIIIADGAGNQRINVSATGNVGIGTDSPNKTLDIFASNPTINLQGGGGTLENTYISMVDTGTSAGNINYIDFAHTNSQSNARIASKSIGSIAANGADMFFETSSDNVGTFNTSQLYLKNNGDVGIGTGSPSVALDVVGSIEYTGTITDVSDRRLKTDIIGLAPDDMMARIAAIDTYSFRMKDDANGQIEFGVMAQELEQIFPELVRTADDEMGTKSVNYVGLIAPMIEAIQTMQVTQNDMAAQVKSLTQKQDDMMAAMQNLKQNMTNTQLPKTNDAPTGMDDCFKYLLGLSTLFLFMIVGGIIVLIRRQGGNA